MNVKIPTLFRRNTLKKPIFALLAVLILTPACATGPGSDSLERHETIPWISPGMPVHRWTLPNGLKLIVLENHSSPTFAWQTWFRVGSRDESPGKTGLAHLFEHMMFKGTRFRKDGEFSRLLDEAGAEGENAFTSQDHTAYIQDLPVESLELIASLESERMRDLIVDEAAFSTEREVVQNERRMRTENSPDGTIYQELFGLAFDKQAYHWPVIGYEADLSSMKAEDAREFYDRWYRPNNATIVVVGDVQPARVLELVRKKYGKLEAGQAAPRNTTLDPPILKPRKKELRLNIQSEKLMLGYRAPEADHADTPAILMLDAVLAAGKSSRLSRALVETGIASVAYGYPLMNVAPSLYLVGATLQPGRKAGDAEQRILREISLLAGKAPSKAEMSRALNQLEFAFYSQLSTHAGIANFLGEGETDLGRFEKEFEFRDSLRKVTPEQVQAAARKWLSPESRVTLVGKPKK